MRKQTRIFLMTALEVAALFLFASQSMAEIPYTTTKSQDCGQNYGAPKGRVGKHRIADPQGGWQTKGFIIDSFGPMPQTAYDPNFGCYPGNARTINRYPAFHGYYYDRPYNYRHYSEFPWNAEMTEPRPYPDRKSEVVVQSVSMQNESIIENATEPAPTPATEPASVTENVPATETIPETEAAPEAAPKAVPVTEATPELEAAPTTSALPAPAVENETKEATPATQKGRTILNESTSAILDDDLLK